MPRRARARAAASIGPRLLGPPGRRQPVGFRRRQLGLALYARPPAAAYLVRRRARAKAARLSHKSALVSAAPVCSLAANVVGVRRFAPGEPARARGLRRESSAADNCGRRRRAKLPGHARQDVSAGRAHTHTHKRASARSSLHCSSHPSSAMVAAPPPRPQTASLPAHRNANKAGRRSGRQGDIWRLRVAFRPIGKWR